MKGLASGVGRVMKMSRKQVTHKRKLKEALKAKRKEDRETVIQFLSWDDNSYEFPSKRHNVRGQGRYSLKDTLVNLHTKYKNESKENKLSLSEFCKASPPHIKVIRHSSQMICLCKKFANICLRADAAKTLPRSPKGIAKLTDKEVIAKLKKLPTAICYRQWMDKPVKWKGVESKKTKLVDLCTTGKSFRTDLLLEMEGFRQHVKTATTQYEQIQILKKNLSPNEEMICQMDYSENWAGKYPKKSAASISTMINSPCTLCQYNTRMLKGRLRKNPM